MNPIPVRWFWKRKWDDSYKAQLCAKGFHQCKGYDFHKVYTAVAKPMSVKIFLALAACFKLHIYHIDIVGAFLNAFLKEIIHIQLPEGYTIPGKCGCLCCTLYRLKQSPHKWFICLSNFLFSLGFSQSQADHSIFFKDYFYILIYVDDLLFLTNNKDDIASFLLELAKHFDYTNNGPVTCYLSLEIFRKSNSIQLNQSMYICNCLH